MRCFSFIFQLQSRLLIKVYIYTKREQLMYSQSQHIITVQTTQTFYTENSSSMKQLMHNIYA